MYNSRRHDLNLEITAVIKRNLRAKFPDLKFSSADLEELTTLGREQTLCNLKQARRGLDLANQVVLEQEKLNILQKSLYETLEQLELAQKQGRLFSDEANRVEIATITEELLTLKKKIHIQAPKLEKMRYEERTQDEIYAAARERVAVLTARLVTRHPEWLEIFEADFNPLDLVGEREAY
jgi:parvulin-like peptidyl-prolyl isomerase